jgi:hypothetical protein
MKPIINLEEKPDKVVGRRKAPSDHFKTGMGLQQLVGQLQKSLNHYFVPKGVYRFITHEEADEWMLKMMARRRKN